MHFFFSHLRVQEFLLHHLHLTEVVSLALLHFFNHLSLLFKFVLERLLRNSPVSNNVVDSFSRLDFNGRVRHLPVLLLNLLHRLVEDLLHFTVLFAFAFQVLAQLVDDFIAHQSRFKGFRLIAGCHEAVIVRELSLAPSC